MRSKQAKTAPSTTTITTTDVVMTRRGAATRLRAVAIVLAATAAFSACGGKSDVDTSNLNEQQKRGLTNAENGGCVACHGVDFKGGTGPSLVGLAGSQVELDDGTTVTADDAYLTESIKKPGAKKVKGYTMIMPENALSDAQIADLVEFIKTLK